jgi:diadenosine tetraphosphatase ApaH/serine/threonine PP2A family protein phosphatase
MEVHPGVGRHWGVMEVIRLEVDLCRLVEVGAMGVEVIWIVEVGRQRGAIRGARGRGREVEVTLIVGVTHLVGVIPQAVVVSVVV